MKIFWRFVILFFLLPIHISYAQGSLTPQQIERVKACKQLIEEVDTKSLQKTIHELEDSTYPELNLQIMEAMTKAYDDIVQEQKVIGLKNKQWLYSMIALNMANLQFGGKVEGSVHRLINYKLKMYLPKEVFAHPGFSKSVE